MEVNVCIAVVVLAVSLLTCDGYQLCGTAPTKVKQNADGTAPTSQVSPVHWPWNAAIHTIAKFRPEQYCGGALITDQHVLTAAHCIDKRTSDGIRIHLGSWRRSTLDKDELAMPVKEMCIHHNFSGSTNDIAVITLAQPVNFTSAIRPVCLPYRKETFPTDSEAYTAGWTARPRKEHRRTRRSLQELKLTLLNKNKCLKYFDIALSEDVLCALHDGGSLCEGDSGAPIMQNIGGHWFLQGILSGGPPTCGDSTLPMVFTRVASFMDNFIHPYLSAKTRDAKTKFCILK
ncbi:chymotrypsinogen B-like [Dermacentor silvarum]|uniref:chymotrypsinogen B-like n=1 Tax=Dermacentor silvarum TaxID=543639 RepID=UPI00189708DA|nr:chymotrypsinogen B-like [Dermacentor silvarum]